MTYLLDTGVWLRGAAQQMTLPLPIRRILASKDETFGLSAISIWEVGKKHQIGKLQLSSNFHSWLNTSLTPQIEILPLVPGLVADAMRMPNFPNRDPADELIVATARFHDLTLLTTDTALKGYAHAKIHYFKPLDAA